MENFNPTITVLKTAKLKDILESSQDEWGQKGNLLFALSDGATQGFYSKEWARLIVENYLSDIEILEETPSQWLTNIQGKWIKTVKNIVEKHEKEQSPLWISDYNSFEEKRPAGGTLLGVKIKRKLQELRIELKIVGDSCFFKIQENYLKEHSDNDFESYPIKSSINFNNTPTLLNSYTLANIDSIISEEINVQIRADEKTYLLLASDALSQWILKQHELKEISLIRELLTRNSENFESWVTKQKDNGGLHDDDITLVLLTYELAKLTDEYEERDLLKNQAEIMNLEAKESDNEEIKDSFETETISKNGDTNNLKEDSMTEEGREKIVNMEEKVDENSNTQNENTTENIPIICTESKEHSKSSYPVVIIAALISLTVLIIFILNTQQSDNKGKDKTAKKDVVPVVDKRTKLDTISLTSNTWIYNDDQDSIITLSNEIQVVVDTNNWEHGEFRNIKSIKPIYVHKAAAKNKRGNWDNMNQDSIIVIKSKSNLRTSEDYKKSNNIIGQLIINQKFDCYEAKGDWCTIIFKGKIKK